MSKTLDRIAALLAQAEGTNIEAEAEAFMAKAQQLATLAAVDLEIARAHQKDKTKREQPISKRITVAGQTANGWTGRTKTQNNAAEFANLFMTIGRVNDLHFDVAQNSTYVIAYGMPSDIEVAEALYASLMVQMKTAVDADIKAGVHKQEEPVEVWDERLFEYRILRPDARRFKTSFYQSFTQRIGARLARAKREAVLAIEATREAEQATLTPEQQAAAPSTETGLVLRKKDEEVKTFRAATSQAKGSWKGGQGRAAASESGHRAGRQAGDSARLGAPAAIANHKGVTG